VWWVVGDVACGVYEWCECVGSDGACLPHPPPPASPTPFAPQWNFTKFLCVNGLPVKRYGPSDLPFGFEGDVRAALTSVGVTPLPLLPLRSKFVAPCAGETVEGAPPGLGTPVVAGAVPPPSAVDAAPVKTGALRGGGGGCRPAGCIREWGRWLPPAKRRVGDKPRARVGCDVGGCRKNVGLDMRRRKWLCSFIRPHHQPPSPPPTPTHAHTHPSIPAGAG
jgi:hypothetical protein